ANLIKKYKLSAWDVETGKGLLLPEQVDGVIELSKKGYRCVLTVTQTWNAYSKSIYRSQRSQAG
ncbi:hypothetical protein, partial [Pseudomonas sp. 74_A]|uniref:hypothetical protein n=1 Tax=Pseudomonas sp. 74_A TaxID=2813565 RepID=UPI001A9E84DF